MSSAHSWKIEYTLLPWRILILIPSDGQYSGSRVKCEGASLDALDKNVPPEPGNTSRGRSQDEEHNAIIMEQPMYATNSHDVWNPIGVTNDKGPLIWRAQSIPTPEICCEGLTAIGNRPHNKWVTLQSNRKKVDFESD
jgi:hypothetical protein